MNTSNEIINLQKLKIIIDNFDNLKKSHWSDKDTMIQLATLKKIYKASKNKNGLLKTDYKFGQGRFEGRKYSKCGIQNLCKDFRNTIADEYYDYDIVNCFPTLLLNYSLEHNYPCVELAKYKDSRNSYIEEYNFNVKDIINQLIHVGSEAYNNVDDKPEWLIKLKNEIVCIQNFIKNDRLEEFQQIKKKNAVGTLVSNILTKIESNILDDMIVYMNNNKINIDNIVLMFDGFMLPKTMLNDEQFIDLQNYVSNKYNISFIRKPMNVINLNGYKEEIEKPTDEYHSVKVFLEWLEMNDYRIFKTNNTEIYFYNKKTGLYSNNIGDVRGVIAFCDLILDKYRYETNAKSKIIYELQHDNNLISLTESEFHQKLKDSTLGKIAFNNGVYDFHQKKLLPFSPDYIFLHKMVFDYEEDFDMTLETEINKKIFLDIFGSEDVGSYVKKILARALASYTEDKKMFFITGQGNSGKGVITDLIKRSFGSFTSSFNANVFAMKKFGGDGDQAKSLSWIVPLITKRIVFSNEINMKQTLNGELMKSVCGGDDFTARQNFQNESPYLPQFTCFLFANDLPEIETLDGRDERFRYIQTKYSYFSGKQYEEKKNNPIIKLADPTIKTTFIKRPDVILTFIYMILNSFEEEKPEAPLEVTQETSEWEADTGGNDKIIDLFSLTDVNAFMSVKECYKIIQKDEGICISSKNIKSILVSNGCKYVSKKVNGKAVKVITGISLTNQYINDDCCDL